eukprot:249054-Chlamydomonas_euryale.AAC.11
MHACRCRVALASRVAADRQLGCNAGTSGARARRHACVRASPLHHNSAGPALVDVPPWQPSPPLQSHACVTVHLSPHTPACPAIHIPTTRCLLIRLHPRRVAARQAAVHHPLPLRVPQHTHNPASLLIRLHPRRAAARQAAVPRRVDHEPARPHHGVHRPAER